MPTLQALRIDAMSLNLPAVAGHINRMPFSGCLTRIGEPSDQAPSGSGGKRILLTHAATEAALPSLLGMGVNLTAGFHGHDISHKVGVISEASIAGNALNIAGFIYCNDHPEDAKAIQANKADLGFSFEAGGLTVETMDADPLTIKALTFTGASILLRTEAAYRMTSLAAAAAKKDYVAVHPVLLKALTSAGFTACEDPNDRLSSGQFDTIMDRASSVSERISLKQLIGEAGIWPQAGG
jgi:hypothetical protein